MRKAPLIGLIAAAVITIACSSSGSGGTSASKNGGGSGDQPAATATEQSPKTLTAKIGEKVTLSNELLGEKTIVDVTVANPKQYTKDGDFLKPEHGIFLVFDVTVVCQEGTYSANPYGFKFVGGDGSAFDGALTISFKPTLSVVNLNKGQKTSGKISFDVPKEALNGGKVQIDGIGLDYDEPAAYWAL
jgi:hypothetical protein